MGGSVSSVFNFWVLSTLPAPAQDRPNLVYGLKIINSVPDFSLDMSIILVFYTKKELKYYTKKDRYIINLESRQHWTDVYMI